MTSILWFKRDLRLADHPALEMAMRHGPIVPLYVYEPGYWQLEDTSGRQCAFLQDCLKDLDAQLRRVGAGLVIRVGRAEQVLDRVAQATGATQLFSHEETGNDWTFGRDRAVARWARGAGVRWVEMPQCAVRRGRHDRDDWSVHRNRWMRAAPIAASERIDAVALPSDPLPGAAPDPCPERQTGGRTEALRLLDSFLHERGLTYRRAMSSPLQGATACSRISPHLAMGCLSVREVAQITSARQAEARGTGWSGSLSSFQSRLAWRDHFMQKLEDEPQIEWREMHPAYQGLRPPQDERLDRWAKGETGLPFVDACMRSLLASGWLNFRMRSMLMAVASYHLWLPWQQTGKHLARMFTDYEPGIHWSQCQMQSGTTGINTLRIYNPVKQGMDQDPTGAFTRRWVPELQAVPDAALQEPWRLGGVKGYPDPIVDVKAAAKKAREAIWAVRQSEDFQGEASRVIRKHASRKDRHFVNDRAPRPRPRRKAKDDRQQSFDF